MKAYFETRRILKRFAALYGVKRRWFGLESNRSLRRRLVSKMRATTHETYFGDDV